MLGSPLIKVKIVSNAKIKRYAEIGCPSLVPHSSLKYSNVLTSLTTHDFGFLIKIFIHFTNSLLNSNFLKHIKRKNSL